MSVDARLRFRAPELPFADDEIQALAPAALSRAVAEPSPAAPAIEAEADPNAELRFQVEKAELGARLMELKLQMALSRARLEELRSGG
jgi:hypothetical protein